MFEDNQNNVVQAYLIFMFIILNLQCNVGG